MTPVIILDADFLSAFLKIGAVPLIREFYQAEETFVPPAVYREIAVTDLLETLLSFPWVHVQAPSNYVERLMEDESFAALGAGEREAIALALQQTEAVLLMNDNRARRVAARHGVNAVNIPAFLLACKMAGLLDRDAIAHLVTSLEAKDHHGFREGVRELLLG